jgi:hypothetical protein
MNIREVIQTINQMQADGSIATLSPQSPMTFDLAKILKSKRDFRRQLAERPIEEKLALLDALRERELAIRQSSPGAMECGVVREAPMPYRTDGKATSSGK